ncbi:MAG: methylated-DNA--[protein]-cysteine S-methyltransferase [Caldimicrobium sp.]|nr:methylated-DNA--[protein]-cysteine S-methyltransferase [Caldimicrobium sp.]MCX7613588.1 methylated-DNA--[protein]-cysteine S-methyltransferase [Caldimicrobium sp.]MDW8183067.1 methylated-DNA--[protein]-cysteine S-methyltransferase [Caldimicrobium sp.]
MERQRPLKATIKLFPFCFDFVFDEYHRVTQLIINWHLQVERPKIDSIPQLQDGSILILRELISYFKGLKRYLDIPHNLSKVTPLSREVITYLREIPSGKVETYGNLAKRFGTSPRAIGQILAHNPLPLIYPCHRIVGMNHIGGYSQGPLTKWMLLYWERF